VVVSALLQAAIDDSNVLAPFVEMVDITRTVKVDIPGTSAQQVHMTLNRLEFTVKKVNGKQRVYLTEAKAREVADLVGQEVELAERRPKTLADYA
jgi:hypothetical protein